MANKINIEKIKYSDLPGVARIHISAFPNSMITKLGAECVLKYYKWQIESPDKVYAIGAFNDERMFGYCFGGVFSMALGGFLVRNKGLITRRLITHPWIMVHPDLIKKIFRGLGILMKFSLDKGIIDKAPSIGENNHFGILAIASDPAARGLGVGRILMESSEHYAMEQNFKEMYLTVNPQNTGAINFYEHIGWIKDGDTENWQGAMKKELKYD